MDDTNQSQNTNQSTQQSPQLGNNTPTQTAAADTAEHTLVQFPKQSIPVINTEENVEDIQKNDSQADIREDVVENWDNPVSLPKVKELEPLPPLSVDAKEVIASQDSAVDLEPDIEAAGVEAVTPLPTLSQADTDAGLSYAKETIPVMPVAPAKTQKINQFSKERATEITKKSLLFQKSDDADVWLAYLWLRFYAHEKKDEE